MITDTAADLPIEIIEENDITIISQIVTLEDKAYRLGKDISFIEFYEKLENIEKIPSTAAPDPASFQEAFETSFKKDKYQYAFCITVSKELSGTYSSAIIAAKKFGEKVFIVDSGFASGVEGLIALRIRELAKNGSSVNEIKIMTEQMKKQSLLCAGFHTFENIYKSGRIKSKFILNATKFFRIKPILVLEEQKTLQPKFPGFFSENHMLKRVLKAAFKRVNRKLVFDMVISHVNNHKGAEKLREKIGDKLNIRNEYITIATPLVGTHTGQRTVILSLVPVLNDISNI